MNLNSRTEGLRRPSGMRRARMALLAITLALLQSYAQGDERSGKDVVEAVCAACHAAGAEGAPRIGDGEAWSSRAAQGLSGLTTHAIEGIRKMPAHGGRPGLSDLEIARAVTYMVNRSGGSWVEPASAEELTVERSGEQVVKARCANCHAGGTGGAPKIGDLDAWAQRLNHGLGYLVRSAIRGHGGMPARGGQANLTDDELRAAILYMYDPTSPTTPRASAASTGPSSDAGANPNHRVAGGIQIYLGYMPAQRLRALPAGSAERSMHGGIPGGPGHYHVNVSLYDEKSRAPVQEARVWMDLEPLGLAATGIELEPMAVGAGSYGNYVKPQPRIPYAITLHIQRSGTHRAVEVEFEHEFE